MAWRGSRGGGVDSVGLAVELIARVLQWRGRRCGSCGGAWWRGWQCDLVILDDFWLVFGWSLGVIWLISEWVDGFWVFAVWIWFWLILEWWLLLGFLLDFVVCWGFIVCYFVWFIYIYILWSHSIDFSWMNGFGWSVILGFATWTATSTKIFGWIFMVVVVILT